MSLFSKIFGTKVTADETATGNATDNATVDPQQVDFLAALSLHLRGDLDQALNAYLRVAQELPDDILAPFLAATIKAGKGNTAEAVEVLRALSQQAALAEETLSHAVTLALANTVRRGIPAVADIIVTFGDLIKKEGFLQESAVCFEIGAGLVPEHSNVLHKLGDTLHDLRIYDYAETVLLEAIKHAPNHWGALYTYAVLLQDLNRNDEAITYYKKAVQLNPGHVNSQNNYGAALLRTNQLDEALVHCNLAAELDRTSPWVKINLGNIHLLKQDYPSARGFFSEAISLNGTIASAYYGLASVEQLLKSDPERIKELYLKAIEMNPSMPEAHQALGNLLANDGNPDALAHFAAAAQLYDCTPNLHTDFANACLKLGRRQEALYHFSVALAQNPDDAKVQEILTRMEAENPA